MIQTWPIGSPVDFFCSLHLDVTPSSSDQLKSSIDSCLREILKLDSPSVSRSISLFLIPIRVQIQRNLSNIATGPRDGRVKARQLEGDFLGKERVLVSRSVLLRAGPPRCKNDEEEEVRCCLIPLILLQISKEFRATIHDGDITENKLI